MGDTVYRLRLQVVPGVRIWIETLWLQRFIGNPKALCCLSSVHFHAQSLRPPLSLTVPQVIPFGVDLSGPISSPSPWGHTTPGSRLSR